MSKNNLKCVFLCDAIIILSYRQHVTSNDVTKNNLYSTYESNSTKYKQTNHT